MPKSLSYVCYLHQNALKALTGVPLAPPPEDAKEQKQTAERFIESKGYEWPAIFSETYPPETPGGLLYQIDTTL
jgi:hypothetical protein